MSLKNCPYCAEEIKAEAIKCRYCKEFLSEETNTLTKNKATLISGKINKTLSDNLSAGWKDGMNDTNSFAVFSGTCIHCSKNVTFKELSGKESALLLSKVAFGNGISGLFKSVSSAIASQNTGESRKCPSCETFIEICPNCLTINKLDTTNPIHACSSCGENLA